MKILSHRWRAFLVLGCAAWIAAESAPGQTKVDISSQSKQADFSQFQFTRPVKTGTVLPGSCLTGELFFKTDAVAGSNLHLCSGALWHAVNSGSTGATNVNGLTDLRVTVNANAVNVAAGRFQALDATGRYTVTEFPAGSVTRTAGSESGTLRIEVDDNGGSPILKCLYGTGLSSGNYSASGCSTAVQSNFSAGAQPLATVSIVNGVWSTPQDLRAMGGIANHGAGTGLIKAGNVFSVNPAVVGFVASPNVWTGKQLFTPTSGAGGLNVGSISGNPSTPADGDLWYNSAGHTLTARVDGENVALGRKPRYYTSMDFGVCDGGGGDIFNGSFHTNGSDTPALARGCNTTSGQAYGVWGGETTSRHLGRWHIPAGAGNTLQVTIVWAGTATASPGDVELAFNWACRAAGETYSTLPSYSADTTGVTGEGSTEFGIRYTSFPVTISGCGGKDLWFKFGRNGTATADTSVSDNHVLGLKLEVE